MAPVPSVGEQVLEICVLNHLLTTQSSVLLVLVHEHLFRLLFHIGWSRSTSSKTYFSAPKRTLAPGSDLRKMFGYQKSAASYTQL